jgi:hypothetical protein
VYSAQPSTCQAHVRLHSHGEGENENAIQNRRLSLCLISSESNQTARAILYQQSPCHRKVFDRRQYSDPLLEVPRDRRLLQKVHRVCDKDPRCPYTLTPHRELYRPFNICILYLRNSGTSSTASRATASPSSLSVPAFLTLPPPPHLSPPHPCTILPQGTAVGITHDVVLKPILKGVTENEGSVRMRYWSLLGLDHSNVVRLTQALFYSPPSCSMHACHFLLPTCYFFPIVRILQVVRPYFQAQCP